MNGGQFLVVFYFVLFLVVMPLGHLEINCQPSSKDKGYRWILMWAYCFLGLGYGVVKYIL